MIEHDVEQGTAAWFQLRAGIPTASEFDKVITPKRGDLAEARFKYACTLIAERLLNWQAESLDSIRHIQEGKAREPLAIRQLEFTVGITTRKVGFLTTDDKRFGASPDRMVAGELIPVEVKAPTIPKQFEYLLFGEEGAYRCQRQGQLWVAEADKAIFYSYHERMPPCLVETGRDEPFIRKLDDALERFSDELEELTERAQSLGIYQAFQQMVTPHDAEYGDGIRRDPLTTEAELAELIERDMQPGDSHRAGA